MSGEPTSYPEPDSLVLVKYKKRLIFKKRGYDFLIYIDQEK